METEFKINISQNTTEVNENCKGATDEQLMWFNDFRYWTEGVVQLILGKTTLKKLIWGNFRN